MGHSGYLKACNTWVHIRSSGRSESRGVAADSTASLSSADVARELIANGAGGEHNVISVDAAKPVSACADKAVSGGDWFPRCLP